MICPRARPWCLLRLSSSTFTNRGVSTTITHDTTLVGCFQSKNTKKSYCDAQLLGPRFFFNLYVSRGNDLDCDCDCAYAVIIALRWSPTAHDIAHTRHPTHTTRNRNHGCPLKSHPPNHPPRRRQRFRIRRVPGPPTNPSTITATGSH